jgi:O-antigen/teichoic acid export membrane protein
LGVSAAAVGGLEAARIYMAPAMLVVSGVSSFLFASYAARSDAPLPELVRLADRSVLTLLCAIGAFCVVAVSLVGWLGPVLTGGKYELSLVTVGGWAAYAASAAAVTPYGQLAAVRGRQVAVLAWRVADSVVSLLAVIVLVNAQSSVVWVPSVLAGGSLLGGVAIRRFVLGSHRDE